MASKIDREIRPMIDKFLKSNHELALEDGGRHMKIRHNVTSDFIVIPSSCSDNHRGFRNLERDIRHLSECGHGLIFAKSGGYR